MDGFFAFIFLLALIAFIILLICMLYFIIQKNEKVAKELFIVIGVIFVILVISYFLAEF